MQDYHPIQKLHSLITCFEAILDHDFQSVPIYRQNILILKQYLKSLDLQQTGNGNLSNINKEELENEKRALEEEIKKKNEEIKILIDQLRFMQLSLDIMESSDK